MDLFSMGVIDDDDRPRQHRPAPVKCYEEALLPRLPPSTKCSDCHVNVVRRQGARCTTCQRDRDHRRRNSLRVRAISQAKHLAKRLTTIGYVVEMTHNAEALARMVADGQARWASPRDKRRLGLREDWRAAVPVASCVE